VRVVFPDIAEHCHAFLARDHVRKPKPDPARKPVANLARRNGTIRTRVRSINELKLPPVRPRARPRRACPGWSAPPGCGRHR
jgi:hypothetical protein